MAAKPVRVLDVGGTKVASALVINGEILDRKVNRNVKTYADLLSEVGSGLTGDAAGIAIVTAGDIEDHRRVLSSPNFHDLKEKEVVADIANDFHLPAVVVNDMEGAVKGMAYPFGEEGYFMGITWSTGIGARIWKNGQIISDHTELGHMKIDPSLFAPLCGCGKRGCIEAVAGGRAIAITAQRELTMREMELPVPLGKLCEHTFASHTSDEEWANAIIKQVIIGMGIFLANVQTSFCLPKIIWKGSIARNWLSEHKASIRAEMRRRLINPRWADASFCAFEHSPGEPDDDALIGGAALFHEITGL